MNLIVYHKIFFEYNVCYNWSNVRGKGIVTINPTLEEGEKKKRMNLSNLLSSSKRIK